jgi:RES domain
VLTYPLPSTRIYRIGRIRNDDGSAVDPWALPDWRYAPFSGRFADPETDAQFRIRYAALKPYGAYVEALQKYRPDLAVLSAMAAVACATDPLPAVGIPTDFFANNVLVSADLVIPHDQGIFDLVTGEGMARAHGAIAAASRASGTALRDYDASTLLSATTRKFTQALSRVVFEYNMFNGIAYRSRFDPDAICIALFEGAHDFENACHDTIERKSADFRAACAVHHLAEDAIAPPAAR